MVGGLGPKQTAIVPTYCPALATLLHWIYGDDHYFQENVGDHDDYLGNVGECDDDKNLLFFCKCSLLVGKRRSCLILHAQAVQLGGASFGHTCKSGNSFQIYLGEFFRL